MSLDFPAWLRATHLLNILFLSLLARSGLEILSAHPKLYWNNGCRPGSEWLRMTKKQLPEGKLWTSHDEEESFSSLVALPGQNHLGLGRHWHFASVFGWILTGVVYLLLLFGTGEWRRLVPTSWEIVPRTWDAVVSYLQFQFPEAEAYNGLQQLTYAAVVFLLSPLLLLTGAAMSPAIGAQFPRFPRLFGGPQKARSLHFLGLLAVAAFTIVHTVMVAIHGLSDGLSRILLGEGGIAILAGIITLTVIVLFHVISTTVSLRSPRTVQRGLGAIVDPGQQILSLATSSRQHHDTADVSPYFRVNGRPPQGVDYEALASAGFADWRLRVHGLVREPLSLSLDDLRQMPKHSTVTTHYCIQGWTNVGSWTGVSVEHLLDQCQLLPSARYAIFRAFDNKGETQPDIPGAQHAGNYYEVIDLELLRRPQAILAYQMNDKPLAIAHGAPLRLHLETQLGFKMVKYLCEIELVEDYRGIGAGMGGWREDVQYYSRYAAI